ncbi:MAG: SPOR domain-containing protein [Candidatus Omnitrophica bacterium]|nr:SPOR domain-containing protein [Candidatus Omnitrophota bacterium]MBU1870497.1 SPOR domain-containing protein [Candidatus Omnitrophota bacterium]
MLNHKPAIRFWLFCGLFIVISRAYALDGDAIEVYFLRGDYKLVIAQEEQVLAAARKDSQFYEHYYLVGLSYMKEGDLSRARGIFEVILHDAKDSKLKEEAKISLGDSYLAVKELDKAQDIYREILKSDPDSKYKDLIAGRLSGASVKLKDSSVAPESSSTSYYSVQVGAFNNADNAETLLQKLRAKDYSAYIDNSVLEGKTVYRVRVGRFSQRNDALSLESKLSREGFSTKICP